METNLQIFENPEFGSVRSVMIDGEPWFVGKDVAMALGYSDTDKAVRHFVDDEDKLTRQIGGSGQNRNMTIINESGVYALIMGSKLPNAKRFKRWVTSEVLTALRKTGSYTMATPKSENDRRLLYARALQMMHEDLEAVKSYNAELEAKIEEDRPKVKVADAFFACDDTVDIRVFAKSIGVNPNRLFDWMRNDKWLMYSEVDGRWYNVPQQRAINQGLMVVKYKHYGNDKKHMSAQARVTTKGMDYFRKLYGCDDD